MSLEPLKDLMALQDRLGELEIRIHRIESGIEKGRDDTVRHWQRIEESIETVRQVMHKLWDQVATRRQTSRQIGGRDAWEEVVLLGIAATLGAGIARLISFLVRQP